jgi:2-polyprenyl-6-hydroxyphenyl methylase/3-demethylubiquinone-9 3-methyltransferase
LEIPVTNAYRAQFVDLQAVASIVRGLGDADRILEVGCGEGALCEQLALAYPEAELLAVDVMDEPGRLFAGDTERVSFRRLPIRDLVVEQPPPFPLVVICDVLHHAPPPEREQLLRDAYSLTAGGGLLVVKEWERLRGVWHGINYISDRYLTGDRIVYLSESELRALLQRAAPDAEVFLTTRVRPRRHNILLALRRPAP